MVVGIIGGLVVNAIVGLAILWLVDYLDVIAIEFGLVQIVITALLGVLGAVLVIVLTAVDVL